MGQEKKVGESGEAYPLVCVIRTKGGVGLGDVWLVEKAEMSFQKRTNGNRLIKRMYRVEWERCRGVMI